jgi:hypothetical protein
MVWYRFKLDLVLPASCRVEGWVGEKVSRPNWWVSWKLLETGDQQDTRSDGNCLQQARAATRGGSTTGGHAPGTIPGLT